MTSEWSKGKVGDLGRVVTGKTPKTAKAENYGGTIPFLTPSDDMEIKYVYKTGKTITEIGLTEVKNTLLPVNSVCVSCIGSDLGKVVITTAPTVTNQQINSIIVDTEKFDVSFVYYAMCILGKELNFISKTSTAVPIVNKSSFSNYEIDCPDLQTQHRIAEVLSTLDAKIENNDRINDNLFAMATALFDRAITENESTLVMSPIGSIADVKGGKRLPKGMNLQAVPNSHPYIRVRDLNTACMVKLTADFEFVDDETQKSIARYTVNTSDVVLSIVGTIGLSALVHSSLDRANLTENCVKFTNLKNVSPEYLLLFLRSTDGQKAIQQGTVGAVQAKLPIKNIQAIPMPLISQDRCSELYAQLQDIFSTISAKLSENTTLAQMRDSLLPKLMSGKVDVSDIQLQDGKLSKIIGKELLT